MHFNEKDLQAAEKEGLLTNEQYFKLYHFLILREGKKLAEEPVKSTQGKQSNTSNNSNKQENKFTLTNFFYYFGAVIIILAMGWYLGRAWENFGNAGLFFISTIYSAIFVYVANRLWNKGHTTPGGLLYACFVSTIPLTVYAFQKMIGIFPDNMGSGYDAFHILIRGGWITMEVVTILAGLYILKRRKFSLIAAPVAYCLWYLSMDIVPLLIGNIQEPTWGQRNFASILIAILMLTFAHRCDKDPEKKDYYSFWFYFFGATILYFAVISCFSQWGWMKNGFAYFMLSLFSIVYMFVAILSQRKIFMVWGALGFTSYLGYLAYTVFEGSPLFPLVLVMLGLAIIYFGIWYNKNSQEIESKVKGYFSNFQYFK